MITNYYDEHADKYYTGTKQVIDNLHQEGHDCYINGCVIHSPSQHAMIDFPTHWREDRGLMERICPHGIGHPDPDTIRFYERLRGKEFASAQNIHGCDGCCAGAYVKDA